MRPPPPALIAATARGGGRPGRRTAAARGAGVHPELSVIAGAPPVEERIMLTSSLRGWLLPRTATREARVPRPVRRPTRARLGLDRLEARDVPSSSIPLNGFTWTPIGPSPIAVGQGPGGLPSTGRLNGVAVDPPNTAPNPAFPSDPNTVYVASDFAGVWRTTDGGATWSPQTDYQGGETTAIAEVNRGTNAQGQPLD